MENINRKNYNAAGKTSFENSPAKVWHVNELVANTTPAPTTPAFKEVFLTTGYSGSFNIGYNTFIATSFAASNPQVGVWTITLTNVADRPSNANKIQVSADVSGGYGIADEIWRVSVYSTAHINGEVTISLYKCNPSTGVWVAANPIPAPHPVYIRVYN
jgi:hypothetical protein